MKKTLVHRVQVVSRLLMPWAVLGACALLVVTFVTTELPVRVSSATSNQSATVEQSDAALSTSLTSSWQQVRNQVAVVWSRTAQTAQLIFSIDSLPAVTRQPLTQSTILLPESIVAGGVTLGVETESLQINVPLFLTDQLVVTGDTQFGDVTVSGGFRAGGETNLASLIVSGSTQLSRLSVVGSMTAAQLTAQSVDITTLVSEQSTLGVLQVLGETKLAALLTAAGGIQTNGADIDAGAGNVFAANIVNEVIAGNNITITGTRNAPIIAFDADTLEMVESLNGEQGELTLTAGTGIRISGLRIESEDNLSLVRSRGGCVGCITDTDVAQNLTITGGLINNTVIGSTTRAAGFFSAVTIGTTTTSTTLTVGGAAQVSGLLTVMGAGTSTFSGGINIADGCYAVNGVCIVGGDISYTGLTDTPDTLTARAVPFVNSAGNALTQLGTFIFDGTRLGVGTDNLQTTLTVGGSISVLGQGVMRWYDPSSNNYVGFRASTTLAGNTTWTLPRLDGAADHVITTDGLGNLRFASVGSIGGGSETYVGLTDTPNLLSAFTIPYVNADADALLHSNSFVFRDNRLGIGVTNPSQTLTVQGSVRFQVSDTQVGMLYDSGTNRFGFGTANPVDRVTIQGGSLTQRGGVSGSLYSPQVRREVTLPTNAFDVVVQGNYAYVTTGLAGHDFHVIDITNPLTASQVASIPLDAGANGVAVQGNYAYVATDVTGNDFHVIDITNPLSPTEVAWLDMPTTATDVAVRGRYAYVTIARAADAFQVVDISNPLQPRIVGSVPLDAAANAVAVQGNYAYVATSLTGNDFHVIDISNPTTPMEVGWVILPDTANDVVVEGRYAYVVTEAGGNDFHVIDISNPVTPAIIGELDLISSANGVYVSGRYAYVTTQSEGADLHVIDVVNPTLPVLVGEVDIASGNAFAVAVSGRYAYVTSGTTGQQFHAIDITGAEFQSALVHTLAGGSLAIQGQSVLTGNVVAGTGLQVGTDGIQTVGSISVTGSGLSYVLGSMGIGTSTPRHQLTVAGSVGLLGSVFDSANATGSPGYVLQSTGSGVLWVATSTLGLSDSFTKFLDLTDTPESYTPGRVLFTDIDGVVDAAGLTFNGTNVSVAAAGGYAIGGVRYLHANTALDSVMLGVSAGATSTGSESVMLGNYAGEFNSGNFSTLIGYGSGGNNQGEYTVALGYDTGYENSGNENIFIGRDAGRNVSGSYNLALGSRAALQQTGSYNEIIGFEAGRNIRGTSSVIIGSEALRGLGVDAFSAERNVALGYRAGYTAAAGASNNILIGYQAASNLSTGSSNIVIGYNIDLADSTQTQTLVIGNLIFGTGLDGTGTTLASGNVGIGTSTPGSRLTVAGYIESTELFGGTGDIQTDEQGRIVRTVSDERLKKNIVTITDALDTVLSLRGVRYEWLDTERFGPYVEVGFIAQEVDVVLPEVVRKGGDYWSLNTRNMVAVVVEAIKELWQVVSGNQEQIAELERRIDQLERSQVELVGDVDNTGTESGLFVFDRADENIAIANQEELASSTMEYDQTTEGNEKELVTDTDSDPGASSLVDHEEMTPVSESEVEYNELVNGDDRQVVTEPATEPVE